MTSTLGLGTFVPFCFLYSNLDKTNVIVTTKLILCKFDLDMFTFDMPSAIDGSYGK